MLINENRLSLADPRARQYLAQQMENYFFGDGADAVQGYVPQGQNTTKKAVHPEQPFFHHHNMACFFHLGIKQKRTKGQQRNQAAPAKTSIEPLHLMARYQ